jgi:hypothetical protein
MHFVRLGLLTIGETPLLEEPSWERASGSLKDTIEAQRRANRLCQEELVVFSAKTRHHKTEHMEERAKDEKSYTQPTNGPGKNITKIWIDGIQAIVEGE